jgi:hypothetical protein
MCSQVALPTSYSMLHACPVHKDCHVGHVHVLTEHLGEKCPEEFSSHAFL